MVSFYWHEIFCDKTRLTAICNGSSSEWNVFGLDSMFWFNIWYFGMCSWENQKLNEFSVMFAEKDFTTSYKVFSVYVTVSQIQYYHKSLLY